MTITAGPATTGAIPTLVSLFIDDVEVSVPKGTLVIRAAEQLGVAIPRFCDHPLLAPAGACRQCLVEVATPGPDGTLRPMPKPQASCTLEVSPGMVVRTQHTSPVAEKAQHGIMEFLLVNHPLDCPVCDKGGECPLQNQAMANGRAQSRFIETKRTFAKPIRISTQVLLDRERCILCQRCTRFSQEIAGDPFIDLQMRGANQQIGTFAPDILGFAGTNTPGMTSEAGHPFASYFSGNTIQICPVGALTGAAYRFRSRPFDLVSSPSACEHCAAGCALRVDHRRGEVVRRLAIDDPAVNEEWNCDKGRWAFTTATAADRITHPMVRDGAGGGLRVASWPEALAAAAAGLAAARAAARGGSGVGVLVGGRVSVEDAYAYAKFTRVVLGSNDVDCRARPHSAEEGAFLASAVAGAGMGVTYADVEAAPSVLLLGLEPEEECPILFLRLRKANARRQRVHSVASWASRGLTKLDGHLVTAAPGTETDVISAIAAATAEVSAVADDVRLPGAVILVGERLAGVVGALSAAIRLAQASGARLAWVPRRAGERGAVEAGALPTVLPGGRPLGEAAARVDIAALWGLPAVPSIPGRDTSAMLAAAARGDLALVIGGVDLDDLPDPAAARQALIAAPFVVSLEIRSSSVTELADVVLPVAPAQEKAGTFVNWEGRWRSFEPAILSNAWSDCRAIDALAETMGVTLGLRGIEAARSELAQLEAWEGRRAAAPTVSAVTPATPGVGQAVLSTWHLLLDDGRMQDGEPYLAGTAHAPVARLSAETAAEIGLTEAALTAGTALSVTTAKGSVRLPVVLTALPQRVVWLPSNSSPSRVRSMLGVDSGALVSIAPAGASEAATGTGEGA